MKELNDLQDLKNKIFPPELEFGVHFVRRGEELIFIRRGDNGNIFYKELDSDKNWEWLNQNNRKVEILGKPLAILDILRMLPTNTMTVDQDTLYINSATRKEEINIGIDLSKPNIKDQSEEVIKQLNKLLCT